MKKRQPKDVPASVKNRLLNLARESGEEFNLLLIRYSIERFLYRLSQSEYGGTFVLKGAILFHLWAKAPHRPTRNVDLMSSGPSDISRMEDIIRQVALEDVADDGLSFDESSVQAERLKEDQEYEGIRVHLGASLGTARIHLQIDIDFGDAITPRPRKRVVPCILDFASPRLSVYPWETVVSEKYQALIELGMTNSRMKDFFDLQYMAREMEFDGASLSKAIRATFDRRKTDLPTTLPVALSSKFTEDSTVRKRWSAFLRRSRLLESKFNLARTADEIWSFLKPVTDSLLSKVTLDKKWKQGGPWQ